MKQKLKINLPKLFKIGMLFLGISLLLWNCQDENIPIEPIKKELEFSSVSEKTARTVFYRFKKMQEKSLNKSSKSKNEILQINPIWSTFIQEKLNFTNALLSSVEVELNIEVSFYTRLIFITINNKILRIIESKQIFELKDNNIEEGYIYYHNLQGKFITSVKVENGIITKRLIQKRL